MNADLLLTVFQLFAGIGGGVIILVLMLFDLWLTYERLKSKWRR